MTLNTLEKVTLLLNILTYRIERCISNLADFFTILTFSVFIYYFSGLIKISFEKIISTLVLTSVSMHFLYFVVYIVNDFIDYYKDKDKYKNFDHLLTLYRLRPVIYFDERKAAVFVMLFWYLICVYLILNLFKTPLTLLFAISFTTCSLLYSLSIGDLKLILFSFLRFLKYLCLIMLLNVFLFDTIYKNATLSIALYLIFPYVVYDTIYHRGLLKEFILLKNKRLLTAAVIFLLSMFLMSFFIQSAYNVLEVIRFTMLSYLLVTIPSIFICHLPLLIFRREKRSFQLYLLILTIRLIMTFLWCIYIGYYIIK